MKVIAKFVVLAGVLAGSMTAAGVAEARKLEKPINVAGFAIIFQMPGSGGDVSLNPQPLPPKPPLHPIVPGFTTRNTDFVEK